MGSEIPTARHRRMSERSRDLRSRTWCDEDNARLRPLFLPNLRVELVKFFPRPVFVKRQVRASAGVVIENTGESVPCAAERGLRSDRHTA